MFTPTELKELVHLSKTTVYDLRKLIELIEYNNNLQNQILQAIKKLDEPYSYVVDTKITTS